MADSWVPAACASVCMVPKQRWDPLRRQQAGRFKSELVVRARTGEISGRLKREEGRC